MGEKQGGKGDDAEKKKNVEGGGEKKKDEEGDKKKDNGSDKKKKDDGPITVVLKVDMHCEGCARKVKRSVKGFKGVENVSADCPKSELTVVGKVDPLKVRDRVESKTNKQVVLLSPTYPLKKDPAAKDEKKAGEKKADDKKPKEPATSTVVLKIRLDCEGCIQRLKRSINKINGVQIVSIDEKEELVAVKGTMDVKTLLAYLEDRLKRRVIVVPPKKDDVGGNKKEKGDKGRDKKKGCGSVEGEDGSAEKKKENGGDGQKKKDEGRAKVVLEANKLDYHEYVGFGGYPPYGYHNYAPQHFSDENPHACSIM